ncbi:hypothetical protein DPMN_018135 [Dreissena polymorpha]|uniref:Uncharacterized protein n=1 Tax=Dreissena polymorpha TaxID=45954 RepID=A0A9D4NGL6_DREPO|nr:hypothetical protein DPMN_018135 [Dreissena polymorpha]
MSLQRPYRVLTASSQRPYSALTARKKSQHRVHESLTAHTPHVHDAAKAMLRPRGNITHIYSAVSARSMGSRRPQRIAKAFTLGNPICCEKLDVLGEVADRFR